MKRYDRYEDGIIIDKQKGENNLLELIRIDDMIEVKEPRYVEYYRVNSEDDIKLVHTSHRIGDVIAIWFRSGKTMTRYELKGESE